MADDFKVLSDRLHSLARPNMYIGSVVCEQQSGIIDYKFTTTNVVPGLIKIIEEIIQNSIDESIRTDFKFANKIDVNIGSDLDGTFISVEDNGRGIPQDMIDGKPRAVHAWTSLRAGSNFDDSKRVGVGSNGVGSSLTNIFSTEFKGITSDGKQTITVHCTNNMEHVKYNTVKGGKQGTKVTFYPDMTRFNLLEFDYAHEDVIKDRLTNFAILFPAITFSFNGTQIKFKNLKQIAKNFHEDSVTFSTDNIQMVFAPSGKDEEFRLLSYVNGIYIKNGGAHVDFVMNKVIETLRAHVLKKHKISVLPTQIKQHLLFASWMTGFPSLFFDSQSKERVTNSVAEVSKFLSEIDFDKISKQILGTPAIIDPMIQSILYKKELEERRELAKKQKAATKVRITNHIAATDQNPENRMLLLCEGLSAINSLIKVRNPKTTGGYSLKGKPLNVSGMRAIDIMKNKEIFEILSIIGLEIGKPATDLNYGKIVVFSDRDLDGAHIFGLLLNLFSLWPDLFREKRIYRMLSPLYVCNKGKQKKKFFSKAEFDAFDSTGWEVNYQKGLGSMSEEDYAECVNDAIVELITLDDLQKLDMAFGDDAAKRKEWMMQ